MSENRKSIPENMESHEKVKRTIWPWLGTFTIVVIASLEVLNVVRNNYFSLTGAYLALACVIALFAVIAARSSMRLRAVGKQFPGSVSSNVVVYPQSVEQLRALAAAMGIQLGRISSGQMVTLVVGTESITILGGFLRLRTLFSIPTSKLLDLSSVRANQGKWVLFCPELSFSTPTGQIAVNFALTRTRFGLPLIIRRSDLATWIEKARVLISGRAT